MATIGSLVVMITGDEGGLGSSLERAGKKLGGFKSMAAGAGSAVATALGTVAVGGAVALGGAFVAAGVKAGSLGSQVEALENRVQTSLGLSEEAAEAFGEKAVEVFGNNFADSITEAGMLLEETRKQLKGLSDEDLVGATQNAKSFSDAFEKDLGETLNATNVLMDEFGLTQKEAFDFLTAGMQRGLDTSGDFLDTVSEYGNLFSDGGASAAQFFSTLETGLAGGVLGTDKIADSFKEFQTGFLEISDDTIEGLRKIGLSYDELEAGIKDGSITMADAYAMVTEAAAGISPENTEARLGLAQLGSQFEDLGGVVGRVDLGATKFEDLAGAADSLGAQYESLGGRWGSVSKQIQAALVPVGNVMMDVFEDTAMPLLESFGAWFEETGGPMIAQFAENAGAWIGEFVEKAGPIVEEFAKTWEDTLGPALFLIEDALDRIGDVMGDTGDEVSGMDKLLEILEGTLDAVVIGLQAAAIAAQGVATAMEAIRDVGDAVNAKIDVFAQRLANIPLIPQWVLNLLNIGGDGGSGGGGGGGTQPVAPTAPGFYTPPGVTPGGGGLGGGQVTNNFEVTINDPETGSMFMEWLENVRTGELNASMGVTGLGA